MQPFRTGAGSALSKVIPDGRIPLFLLSGYLVFQLYWTVVQAAWLFEQERKGGTLEVVFLTPASKMVFPVWTFHIFTFSRNMDVRLLLHPDFHFSCGCNDC